MESIPVPRLGTTLHRAHDSDGGENVRTMAIGPLNPCHTTRRQQ